MRTFAAVTILLAALPLLFIPPSASAQGALHLHEPGEKVVIIPPPHPPWPPVPPRPPRPQALQPAVLTQLRVEIAVAADTARVTFDQAFRNPNARRLEGTYLFPLPEGAVVDDMSLYIDGEAMQCEVLEADKARDIYEDIVRRSKDPALLEYVGRDLVRLRIFPIEAGSERRVTFSYSQVLQSDFGMRELRVPLLDAVHGNAPVESFVVDGTIRAKVPIASLYSPTHDLEFTRPGNSEARFALEESHAKPARTLRLFYSTTEKQVGASLLTHRKAGETGFFLLMLAPRGDLDIENRIPKDVTFVFDTSGSMRGEKITQARKALDYCLQGLREDDRFNIVRFSTDVEPFSESMRTASPEAVTEATAFVNKFEARGGTAIHDALIQAIDSEGAGENGRPHIVVFLTDGKATVGETEPERIVEDLTKRNDGSGRLFVFGVGYNLDASLLDRLGEQNGGVSDYVTPDEDIEMKISNFFSRLTHPVLTDLELDLDEADASKVYPRRLPDLFLGSQLTMLGRYDGTGSVTAVLKGRAGDEEQVQETELEFPAESNDGDFLPRLWAIRRVGHLVEEIRRNGESDELKDEIVALGKRYAVATPYTSMLVLEDDAARPAADIDGLWGTEIQDEEGPARRNASRSVYGVAGSSVGDAFSLESALPDGRKDVALSMATREMKEAERTTGKSAGAVRSVGARTFVLREGVWTQSDLPEDAEPRKIEYGSDAYFDLLQHDDADLPGVLALGSRVIFQMDGVWIEITQSSQD